MEIRYLFHSGFAVETGAHLLIFDYYKDTPRGGKLVDGVIDPAEVSGRDVVVFASHSHGDHYSPVIFGWRGTLPRVRYVLSDDIRTREEAFRIGPGETLDLGDLSVRALRSTDAGAAFLVRTGGKTIFHAGDLNWWHWNGETDSYNARMARDYRREIDTLRGEKIDLAFLPVDPRLEDKYLWGIDYFMRAAGADMAVPMHLWEQYGLIGRLRAEETAAPYRARIAGYSRRGERVTL